jgi:LacI family transcriptional regulator
MAQLASIATALGVSVSTVSRALRRHPAISPATIRRVEEEAARQGHRPNPYVNLVMAHMRRSGPLPHTATLAWIDSFPRADDWRTSPVQRQFFAGAKIRAEARGFHLERLRARGGGIKPERFMGILHARGILGALCPEPSAIGDALIDPARLATVTVGFRSESPTLHFSTNDQYATARAGHRALLDGGCKRVGFITRRYLEKMVDYRFTAGYLSVAAEHGETAPPPFLLDEQDATSFAAWLQTHRPDALLTTVAPELPELLASAGRAIPRDFSAATLDWQADRPELAGLRQNHERVGAAAVDLLVAQIENNEIGPPENARGTLVESVWHDGPSLHLAQRIASR